MGLFDKKFCDFCGQKIGLLGNRKLEDGNMCKECAAKLSPWFSERRHSTKDSIRAQLEYREENKKAVAQFHTTRSIGNSTKLLIDEDARKFIVTDKSNLTDSNPDVLDYSQVTGCNLDIEEDKDEVMRTDKDGNEVSYVPPRYSYSYEFFITIMVNNPFFDEMRFSVSDGSIDTGERPMTPAAAKTVRVMPNVSTNDYVECLNIANEIKETVDAMRTGTRDEVAAARAPKTPVICPHCGANTVPDDNGCCEYCGAALN